MRDLFEKIWNDIHDEAGIIHSNSRALVVKNKGQVIDLFSDDETFHLTNFSIKSDDEKLEIKVNCAGEDPKLFGIQILDDHIVVTHGENIVKRFSVNRDFDIETCFAEFKFGMLSIFVQRKEKKNILKNVKIDIK